MADPDRRRVTKAPLAAQLDQRLLSRPLEAALVVLFFVSGATSLVYETLWARQLHLFFGTSQLAISTVLAAFMGGLAAGGFAAARWAGRVANPVAAYAGLEAFIGAYALVFPLLLTRAQGLFLASVASGDLGPVPRATMQLVLAGVLLLPPTLCMGATLPLLARFATAAAPTGTAVGRLYGVNTLGAVMGTALAGFVLLPFLGLATTTWVAAAANGVLALAAGLAAHAWRQRRRTASIQPADARSASRARVPVLLLLMAAATGFTGLLYEVAWFRLMSLLLGGSAYAFSIMLLAFLLGIGLGGLIGGWLLRRRGAAGTPVLLADLARIQIGIGLLSWSAMFAYGQLPYLWVRWFGLVRESWPLIWTSQLAIAIAIMMPPAVLMGVSFPYLTQLASSGASGGTERVVGLIYGANTLGSIGGAVAGALLVLPSLHVRGAILVGASLNVGIALLAQVTSTAARPFPWRRSAALGAAALSVVIVLWWKPPPWDPLLMTSGVYQYVRKMQGKDGAAPRIVDPNDELLFYDEGLTSVVTVARDSVTGNIWLANNGKVDASTSGDLKTQVLLAQLGFAFRPQAREVVVVGLASGITAGSVTLRPAPRAIDVVEIEPVIVEASREFNRHNHRPLDDPRVRLVIDDARSHFLRVADGHYDLVVSEPSNPWLSGVSNLFTREFFALGRDKLAADGVWVQWLHCYGMSAEDLRSLLATFASVYPEVQIFRVDAADLIAVGSRSSLRLSSTVMQSSLTKAPVAARELAALGIGGAEDLLAHHLFGRDRLLELAGKVELNTDDNMKVEYSAPLHLYRDTAASNDKLLLDHAELPMLAVDSVLGLFALAKSYTNLGLDARAEAALAAAHQLAVTQASEGSP